MPGGPSARAELGWGEFAVDCTHVASQDAQRCVKLKSDYVKGWLLLAASQFVLCNCRKVYACCIMTASLQFRARSRLLGSARLRLSRSLGRAASCRINN